MLLGQLYYFDKKLESVSQSLQAAEYDSIELMGVSSVDTEVFNGQDLATISRTFRDIFSGSYLQVLQENKLTFAAKFWGYLTSPITPTSTVLAPKSEFQGELLQWLQEGASLQNVSHLIKSGQLTSDEEDFALYYGLHALSVLSVSKQSAQHNINVDDAQETVELNQKSQILIVTDRAMAPLFTNINCIFTEITDSAEQNVKNTQQILLKNPEVSLILVVSDNSSVAETVELLQKKVDPNIFVTTLSFSTDSASGYFDDLVRKTLGVKLV